MKTALVPLYCAYLLGLAMGAVAIVLEGNGHGTLVIIAVATVPLVFVWVMARAQARVASLQQTEIRALKEWKASMLNVCGPIFEYAQNVARDRAPLGSSIFPWLIADHKRLKALEAERWLKGGNDGK